MSLRMTTQVQTRKWWFERLGEAIGLTGLSDLAVAGFCPELATVL